jgi:hypothetical protein
MHRSSYQAVALKAADYWAEDTIRLLVLNHCHATKGYETGVTVNLIYRLLCLHLPHVIIQ